MKSQIIKDNTQFYVFVNKNHAHFTYNREPTFQPL